ncbi:MAG: carboxypeptidase regulatory-like domain-containing protein [candidate division KSB1 bacterium]|nr:carboxypeptidase regulatory-like domain-containing protein [candidate division KSB1 bacterium]
MSKAYFVASVLILLAPLAWGQQTGRLEGVVVDASSGKGIAQATLVAYPRGEGRAPLAAETDERGQFAFSELPPGLYALRVSAQGYQRNEREDVVVTAGKSKSLTIKLEQAKERALTTRSFDIKYKDPEELAVMIRQFLSSAGEAVPSNKLRALTVRDWPERLDKVAELLARYDVPPKQVRVDVHLFLADGTEQSGGAIPSELSPVVGKLRNLFRYEHFSLLGSGTAIVYSGEMCALDVALAERSHASCRIAQVEYVPEGAGVVRLEKFAMSGQSPAPVNLMTSLNVPLGEFVVVGRASTKGAQQAAVAVVKAELVK